MNYLLVQFKTLNSIKNVNAKSRGRGRLFYQISIESEKLKRLVWFDERSAYGFFIRNREISYTQIRMMSNFAEPQIYIE